MMNPTLRVGTFRRDAETLLSWSDLVIWGGFLIITAYATGTRYEHESTRGRPEPVAVTLAARADAV
jgi:hypothetical protein